LEKSFAVSSLVSVLLFDILTNCKLFCEKHPLSIKRPKALKTDVFKAFAYLAATQKCSPQQKNVRRNRKMFAATEKCSPQQKNVRRNKKMFAATKKCSPQQKNVRRNKKMFAATRPHLFI
jgi:hypothetical protein